MAAKTLLDSPAAAKAHPGDHRRHEHRGTRNPPWSCPGIQKDAQAKQTSLSVHFVAFDVAASTFDAVKKQGATVVGAEDEKQLNSQLNYILQEKILLEDEEPKK